MAHLLLQADSMVWDKLIGGQVGFALATIIAGWVYCKIIRPDHAADRKTLVAGVEAELVKMGLQVGGIAKALSKISDVVLARILHDMQKSGCTPEEIMKRIAIHEEDVK